MLKNFTLLFLRNFRRQKLFSAINLLGLTVSMVSTLLIYIYVSHEFSYDRFHHNADRIYRVNQTFIWGEGDNHQFASTGPGVATALREELPEVELMTSLHTPGSLILSYTGDNKEVRSFEEEKVLAADSNFFQMFNFPMIYGEPGSALRQANTLVMTESTAKRYFGAINPVGKLLRSGQGSDQQTFEVTAVVKDPPGNTYINFNVLVSMTSYPRVERFYWSWVWTQLETYVRFRPGTDMNLTLEKLKTIPRKHAEVTLKEVMKTTYDEYIKSGKKWDLFLQPLTSIHLPSEIVYNRLSDPGNIKIIYSLIGAGFFIVLLSCINFMNLSTAQFTRRIKEASIRKILGLGRRELSIGYFLEAAAFCVLALVIAIAVCQLVLPGFSTITGKVLTLSLTANPMLIPSVAGLLLTMIILSGIYPAIFLSAFQPAEAIKGKVKTGHDGKTFRNGLVIFQFSISIILIICTGVVFEQLNYVSEKDLGFDKENLLVIKRIESLKDGETLTNAAKSIPGVVSSTRCTSLPPTVWGGDKFSAEGMSNTTLSLNYTTGDEQYIPTLNIKLKLGRNFSKDNPGDVNRVIVNEATLSNIGWPLDETSIGKKLSIPGSDIRFEIVGVVADFHYWSLESAIQPMAIFHIRNQEVVGAGEKEFIALRIAAQDSKAWKTTLTSLEQLWKVHAGDAPFQYSFVDDAFAETFHTQQQFGNALSVLAVLALVIAGLGLLAMIVYTLEQRTKEIGIRKVSGASVWNILTLIASGYTRLVIAAFLIGAPVAWWIMNQWLEDFTYRIQPSPWLFAAVGIGTLITAVAITSYHSVKAALTNPVDVLKDE